MALAAVAALIGSLALVTAVAASGFWKAPPFSAIGINNIYYIDNTFAEGGPESNVLRVWMETGSSTEKCLATLGEAYTAPGAEGRYVHQLYCSSRNPILADGDPHWGVLLTLDLEGSLPTGSWYSVNVYQEGARFFGPPMPMTCDADSCTVAP
jgi:hypothetical protein